MFYSDYHTHTSFSSDSRASMDEMLSEAERIGLKEIAITDHIDHFYPDPEFPFLFDYTKYQSTIRHYQEVYKNRLCIRLGVEIGIQENARGSIKEFLKNTEFDFIIGSTHCIDNKELHGNDFYKGKTQHEAYQCYFESVLHCAKTFDFFQVYGHMDYANRYGEFDNRELHYKDYADVIDEILKALIAGGKGLEVNTSGYRYGLGYTHPQLPVLRRYKELGGEIITVGSDAHSKGQLADHFTEAFANLKLAGFKAYTLFEKQKPIWRDIPAEI